MKPGILILFILIMGIQLKAQTRPSQIPENDPLYALGYLNVQLYGADPSGEVECSEAIQNAINDAQKYKLACYFPSGTYLVDTILSGVMPCTWTGSIWINDRREPIYIVGEENPRPVIKLAANAPGFSNPASPKPLLWLRAQSDPLNPENEQPNIGFNMVVRNIIFDLNQNRGAIGVRAAGAQGSTLEDLKVIATGAHAGFMNHSGEGAGCYNIEVEGGDHAMIITTSGFPTFIGFTCKNQVQEIFKIVALGAPMLVAGFHFVKETGPILNDAYPFRGGLTLVDGIIEYTGSTPSSNTLIKVTNNLYVKNVFVKNCNRFFSGDAGSALDPASWTHINEYRYTGNNGLNLSDGAYINDLSKMETSLKDPPHSLELIRKHTWDPLIFPSIFMRNNQNFVSVGDAVKMTGPSGTAKGNGTTNDTEALQWAIDNYEIVYLPKGTYITSKPITLRKNTQLFGSGKTYSVIKPSASWDSGSPKTLINTVSDAEATTSLSFILLETNPANHKDMNYITWQAGPGSIIRDIMIGLTASATVSSLEHQMMKITGPDAGGRIYAFTAENQKFKNLTGHPGYRHILIENTSRKLKFYGVNVERILSGVQFEIRNSSDVEIYYLKAEAGSSLGNSTPLLVNHSTNIRLFCMGGNIEIDAQKAMFESVESTNIMATHIKSHKGTSAAPWYSLKETFNAGTFTINSATNAGIFTRQYDPALSYTPSKSGSETLRIFPNPTNDKLFIDTGEKTGYSAVFYSISGKLIHKTNLQSSINTLDLNFLTSGLYLVNLHHPSGEYHSLKLTIK